MATYREVYFDRIDKAETDDEVRQAYKDMIDDSNGDVELVNQNLGYILGYYNNVEMRDRWYRLLDNVVHPVFGRGFGRGLQVSPEEALEKGKTLAKAIKA